MVLYNVGYDVISSLFYGTREGYVTSYEGEKFSAGTPWYSYLAASPEEFWKSSIKAILDKHTKLYLCNDLKNQINASLARWSLFLSNEHLITPPFKYT